MAWKPIATAPKDGTVILLFDPEGIPIRAWGDDWDERTHAKLCVVPGKWDGEVWSTVLGYKDGYSYESDHDSWIAAYVADAATHWMPLPQPPRQ